MEAPEDAWVLFPSLPLPMRPSLEWSVGFVLNCLNCYFFDQVTEDEYPYTSGDPWGDGDDQKCKFDARTTEVDT